MRLLIAFASIFVVGALAVAQEPAGDADRPSFSAWLEGVRQEALERGIRPEIVTQALSNIEEPLPIIIERDRTQAEALQSLETYVRLRLTTAFVRTGRERLGRHRDVLDKISEQYGVPGPILVSIWGMESSYGRFSGIRPTVAALATLAWDPRRSGFFRRELFEALDILNAGDIDVLRMRGSWAGAMGQPQFMPSSYRQYAQDFDGDGRRDIWDSTSDVFASIANYLKGRGWIAGESWGREVTVPAAAAKRIAADVARRNGSCSATRDMTVYLPLSEWRRFGVLTTTRRALPDGDREYSMVSGTSRRFLVSSNYDALLEYNCAHPYAISVALLANRIAAVPAAAPKPSTPAPKPEAPKPRPSSPKP